MKRILFFLLLVNGVAYGQEDTSQYIKYPTTYGVKYPRVWANMVRLTPQDTTQLNAAPGVLQIGPDGNLYLWNGVKWILFVTPAQMGDSLSAFTLQRAIDNSSVLTGNTWIDNSGAYFTISAYDMTFQANNAVHINNLAVSTGADFTRQNAVSFFNSAVGDNNFFTNFHFNGSGWPRTITFPDATGTVGLLSNIDSAGRYSTLYAYDGNSKGKIISGQTCLFIGDSYFVHGAAFIPDLLAAILNITAVNFATGGTSWQQGVDKIYANNDTTRPVFAFYGLNTFLKAGADYRSKNYMTVSARALIAGAYLRSADAGNDASIVKTSGTWNTISTAKLGTKALRLGGLPVETVSSGATVTWTFTGTAFSFGTFTGDGENYITDSFSVYVDTLFLGKYCYNNYNPNEQISANFFHYKTQAAFTYTSLPNTSHTVTIIKGTNTSASLAIDYMGVLVPPRNAPTIIMSAIPHMTQQFLNDTLTPRFGYPITNKTIDTLNEYIYKEIKQWSPYPVFFALTNSFYDSTGLTTGTVHPSDSIGINQIIKSICARIDNSNLNFSLTQPGMVPAPVTSSGRFLSDAGTWVGSGYTLQGQSGNLSPADGVSEYIAANAASASTTSGNNRLFIPRAGTIKKIYAFFDNNGTLGTSETSTINIRLNNSTNTLVSSAVNNSTNSQSINSTALSIAVAAGDYIALQWVCPTWATNPTNVRVSYVVYIE